MKTHHLLLHNVRPTTGGKKGMEIVAFIQIHRSHPQTIEKRDLEGCRLLRNIEEFLKYACNLQRSITNARERVYAAAVYWRVIDDEGRAHIMLAVTKASVAPLKLVSIPRLDLVAEIEEKTAVSEWRWTPSSHKVAKDTTRDVPRDFNRHHRWFTGSTFIYEKPERWPTDAIGKIECTGEERTYIILANQFWDVWVKERIYSDLQHRRKTRTRISTESRRFRPYSRFHPATKHLTARDYRSHLRSVRQDSTCSRRTNERRNTSEADEETHHPAYTAHRQERGFTTIGTQRRSFSTSTVKSSGGSDRIFRGLLQKWCGGGSSYDTAETNNGFGWLLAVSKKLSDASFIYLEIVRRVLDPGGEQSF
ncbi:hypothetical protein EVAR_16934_1 [Eumeta japonica]|uniref:Uncharacterized protein n=1 Tax=Eumeta variegata TaxID=151549 RepID=A0A4C1TVG6_EUMVA|nr:hypothetical protein EVAR_16934_1 [Eumeta japonica]